MRHEAAVSSEGASVAATSFDISFFGQFHLLSRFSDQGFH